MPNVTNNTRETMDFVTGFKDGEAMTESVAPGETKNVPLNMDDPVVKGRIAAQAITVDAGPAKSKGKATGE